MSVLYARLTPYVGLFLTAEGSSRFAARAPAASALHYADITAVKLVPPFTAVNLLRYAQPQLPPAPPKAATQPPLTDRTLSD